MKHVALAWFKYSPLIPKTLTEGCLLPYSVMFVYCPDPEVQFQFPNMGLLTIITIAGIRQLYIIRPEETSNGHWS
jgi:hypothetical protein